MPPPAPFNPTFHANFKSWAPSQPKSLNSHSLVASCSLPSKSCHDPPRNTLPPPKHHLPARPPAEVCLSFSTNTKPYTPPASQSRAPESTPPPSMPRSESPGHGPPYLHDLLQVTPNSPRIVACNTRDPTPPDEPPPLEEGATGPGPSSPSTASSDRGLEEFPVLQNDNIPIDPATLADGRPWEASELLPSFWQGNSPAIPEAHCLYPEPPLSMFCGAPDHHQGCMEGFDGWNENAQKDKHPHIQACPQLHPSHLSTETDTPCSSGVGEGSSSKQSESLKRGAEGLEEQTTKQPRIASTLPTHSFITSAACLDYHGEIGPTRHGPSKGKKGDRCKQLWRWSPEDDARLLSMIEDRQSWPEIERCFPGRTESALRQRQSTLRKRRNRRGLDPARSTTNTTNTHVSVASSPRPDTPAVAASAVDSPAHISQNQPPTSPRPPRYPRVEVVIPTRLPHSRSTTHTPLPSVEAMALASAIGLELYSLLMRPSTMHTPTARPGRPGGGSGPPPVGRDLERMGDQGANRAQWSEADNELLLAPHKALGGDPAAVPKPDASRRWATTATTTSQSERHGTNQQMV
ncbi:hypothetical protein ACJ73_05651 [Blastomyces percursus]|uniref:Myb-like domain-containing protein n=1 Tax=Blastomyces percursus TaxID=1658174 RepID=A0A1J9Q4G9_9EURO|nr:hypothetical protein ACJ73_05651 [Blastomyces percursus]